LGSVKKNGKKIQDEKHPLEREATTRKASGPALSLPSNVESAHVWDVKLTCIKGRGKNFRPGTVLHPRSSVKGKTISTARGKEKVSKSKVVTALTAGEPSRRGKS